MDQRDLDWADLHQQISSDANAIAPTFTNEVGDWFSKGVPLAVASGAVSIINTAVSLGNVLGADIEKIDLGGQLADYDDSFARYYQEHKEGIDLGGFLATSIFPGIGGIKALKLLQGGVVGRNASEVTGLLKNTQATFGFFRNKEAQFTEKMLDKIRKNPGEIFSAIDRDKLVGIAAGVGDQALQGAAFQTAVLLTMNQSPVLSKPDEDYFTSFIRNSPEIFTAALIQGAIGGVLSGVTTAGKIKKAVSQQDIQYQSARHVGAVGESDIDEGTKLSLDFAFLQNKKVEFARRKEAGELSDGEILSYQSTIEKRELDLRLRLTEQLIEKGQAVGGFNEQIWKLIIDSEDPAETANLLFSTATKVSRITAENQQLTGQGLKVYTSEGELPFRKALNIFARGKIAPDIFNPQPLIKTQENVVEMKNFLTGGAKMRAASQDIENRLNILTDSLTVEFMRGRITKEQIQAAVAKAGDSVKNRLKEVSKLLNSLGPKPFSPQIITDELIAEWTGAGYELYRDAGGMLHVLEDNRYVKGILGTKHASEEKNPSILVKLGGDGKGQVTEVAYPVVGDLGKPSLSKSGNLLVDEKPFANLPHTLEYDPIKQEPLTSNAHFLKAKLTKFGPEIEEEGLFLKEGDIPMLEKLATEGFEGGAFYGDQFIEDAGQLLYQEKLVLRQKLIEEGHDFARIARELNVTREFAETGRGEFILSKIEDHTLPQYAKIDFATGVLPDSFYIRGVKTLMTRLYLGRDHNQKAAAYILGDSYKQLAETDGILLNPSTMPSFSGFVTSALPDYGTLDNVMTQAGKVLSMLHSERATKIFQSLQGLQNQIRGKPAALQEVNFVVNKVRSMGEPVWLFEEEGGETYIVPSRIFKAKDFEAAFEKGLDKKEIVPIQNKEVADFFSANQQIVAERAGQWNAIHAAKGSDLVYDVDEFFLPPINVKKYPFVNFVQEKMDIGPGNINQKGVIVAPTEQALNAKVNQLSAAYGDKFEFFTPSDIKIWKKAVGEYEDTPFLRRGMVDSALDKEGLLYEFQPRLDDEILNDINSWHWQQERRVLEQAIELKYSQEFAELNAMGKKYQDAAKDRFGVGDRRAAAAQNPYYRYIATALNKSSFDPDSLWGKFNGMVEGVGQKMFGAWDTAFEKASKGEIDWQTANQMAESYGFTAPYKALVNGVLEDNLARELVQPRIENLKNVQGMVAKVNGAVSTLTLGLDFLNSLVNVISFPILGLSEMRNVIANIKDPKIAGALADLTSVKLPDAEIAIPSSMKLLISSISRLFGPERKTLEKFYQDIGALRTQEQLYTDVIGASSIPREALDSPEAFKKWTETLHEAAIKIGKVGKQVTGYNKAEFTVRFLAADMMKQVVDIAKVPLTDQPAYINAFVNRVHGNYVATQRPQLFQGAVGQAISLFQTYQFNIMQNMVRYVETGNKTTAAMLLGLQNTIFGLQGNPAFYLLNQAVGSSNREHVDIVNSVQTVSGSDMSKWILYGLGSNALQTSLYNRGDLTPRQATIVPIEPLEIPGVAIPLKAMTSFVQTISTIAKGGNVTNALLDGVAHLGANRPLSGLAQLTQGYRTSAKGDLITSYSDLEAMTVAAKLAGGEELNRAIALDAYHRNLAYKAHDASYKAALGKALQTTMYKGQTPTQEQTIDFMKRYTDAGGTPLGFNRWIQNSFRDANQSQMNRLKEQLNSRAGRLQANMMGADSMPDFFNSNVAEEE